MITEKLTVGKHEKVDFIRLGAGKFDILTGAGGVSEKENKPCIIIVEAENLEAPQFELKKVTKTTDDFKRPEIVVSFESIESLTSFIDQLLHLKNTLINKPLP
jgi:hypothetical protein